MVDGWLEEVEALTTRLWPSSSSPPVPPPAAAPSPPAAPPPSSPLPPPPSLAEVELRRRVARLAEVLADGLARAPGRRAVEQLAAQLPNASADQQRMLLGEALYPLVDSIEPASSAKITGMLLEMDQSEVLHLIEDSKALSDKVQEAVTVLKAAAAEDA